MAKPDLDPMGGSFRWAWRRGRSYLDKFVVGVVLVGVVAAGAGAVFVSPSDATPLQRLISALFSLVVALVVTLALTFGFALVRAPYQQRDALRGRVLKLAVPAPPHPNHVTDLQKFARDQQERLNKYPHFDIELNTALGRALSAHYPEVSALAETLNDLDVSTPSGKSYQRIVTEATRLGLRDTAAVNLLSALTSYLNFSELAWKTQGNEVVASARNDENYQWTFYAPDADTAEKIRAELYEAASHVRELPEVRANLEVQSRWEQLHSEVLARLDFVERNHNLAYRADCELCTGSTPLLASGQSASSTEGSRQ